MRIGSRCRISGIVDWVRSSIMLHTLLSTSNKEVQRITCPIVTLSRLPCIAHQLGSGYCIGFLPSIRVIDLFTVITVIVVMISIEITMILANFLTLTQPQW